MLGFLISLASGAAGGALAGAVVVWWARNHSPARSALPDDSEPLDAGVATDIMNAAREYAAAHGRPETADLVARKLLVAIRYHRRRGQEPRL